MSDACNGKRDQRVRRPAAILAGTLGGLFATAMNGQPAYAATTATVRSYLVTYAVESPAGAQRSSETLTLRSGIARPLVSVSNASGASLSLPTSFGVDGEIMQNTTEPSVICYNMAAAILAQQQQNSGDRSFVTVALGDGTVPVPLTLRHEATPAGETLIGSGQRVVTLHDADNAAAAPVAARLVVDARLSVANGELHDATFTEATVLEGSATKPASRVACSLSRLQASDT